MKGDTNDRTPEVKSGAPHAARVMMYVVSRNETYSGQQYHGPQISLAMVVTDTIRECQMMVTTKKLLKC